VYNSGEFILVLLALHCASHAILYFSCGLSAKKEVEKQSRKSFS